MNTTTDQITVRATPITSELLESLSRRRSGKYCDFKAIFHCIPVDTDRYCGVVGDGDNGCYEWFTFDRTSGRGVLEVSDCGYGIAEAALRDVLNLEVPK
jgi:hypothetical protein